MNGEMTDKLSLNGIKKHLGKDFADVFTIELLDTVDSTNKLLKERGMNGAPQFSVAVSSRQTEGRGRLGRSFFSPEGGVYMSVLVRPQGSACESLSLTTAAAVSVCEALDVLGVKDHGIKWVNDIYISGKKVCGILTEGVFAADGGVDFAVVGVGINLFTPENGFADDIKDKAAAVFAEQKSGCMDIFASEFLKSFYGYAKGGKNAHVNEYIRRNIVVGKNIRYVAGNGGSEAFVTGIDGDCSLLVRCADGSEKRLFSGEISQIII